MSFSVQVRKEEYIVQQNTRMNLYTRSASEYIPTSNQWKGDKPQKFYGGRKHDNHPLDQLDNLLLGHDAAQFRLLGPSKRRFDNITTIGTDSPPKPHIRPNAFRNQSSIQFGHEYVPNLIKINQQLEQNPSMSPIYRHSRAGQSKLKNLENGYLQTGIYRNFYKNLYKSELKKSYETVS